MNLNDFKNEVHAQNVAVGWWDGEPCLYEKLQLVSTEVAEATEGERKNLMDDKLPHRRMGEVELADALIRTLDLMGKLEADVNVEWVDSMVADSADKLKGKSVGEHHFAINHTLVHAVGNHGLVPYRLNITVALILAVGNSFGYDVLSAAREKHEFNKTRADHKRENRATEHGKKF